LADRDLLLHCPAQGAHTNDFTDLNTLAERLLDFQYDRQTTARLFDWKFTRQDLEEFLSKLSTPN